MMPQWNRHAKLGGGKTMNHHFDTRFFFGENGEVKIISAMPLKIKDDRPNLAKGKNLILLASPVTSNKLELAGAAINALTNRVKAVHGLNTDKPQPK